MAITIYSGLPGKGKTALATLKAVKKYRRDNSIIRKVFKKNGINRIYSNYPILLNMKKKVYSHPISLMDLQMTLRFPKGSLIIIDEVQRYYDSREFKTFPKNLGIFLQHHRHADIDDIILITQHPRRIDNKMRDLSEVYRKHRTFITIPFIPIGMALYTNYYEFDDYGKYHKVKKEAQTYDLDNHIRFFIKSNIFGHYNSKYYHVIFDALDPILNRFFTGTDLTADELNQIGHTQL